MIDEEYWTPRQLRAFLKCPEPKASRVWYGVKPFFAPALRKIGTFKLYHAGDVRRILEGQRAVRSPMQRSARRRAMLDATEPVQETPAPRPRPTLVPSGAPSPSGRVPLLRRPA